VSMSEGDNLPCALRDAHFFSLPSGQGSVYCLTEIQTAGVPLLLVASLHRAVHSLQYVKDLAGQIIPTAKPIQFTYIPSGAEIISLDAFKKPSQNVVIGITITKGDDKETCCYLNIYYSWEEICQLNEQTQPPACHTLKLSYTPYQLYHTSIYKGSTSEIVWLVCGSDNHVHLYREDTEFHDFKEDITEQHFPELDQIPGIVLAIHIVYTQNHTSRITAFGCETGSVRVSVVSVDDDNSVESWEDEFDGPVTSVQLFTSSNHIPSPTCLPTCEERGDLEEDYHLLVTNSLQESVVYSNVIQNGLSVCSVLPGSEGYDCVTCGCVADIDMDGNNEIILGTYGQELLVYKCIDESWTLLHTKLLSSPIHSLLYTDMMGDGVNELVVLTTKGLNILQHDPISVTKLCEDRLRALLHK